MGGHRPLRGSQGETGLRAGRQPGALGSVPRGRAGAQTGRGRPGGGWVAKADSCTGSATRSEALAVTAASSQAPGLRPRATRPLCPSAEPPAPAGFWVSHEKTPAGVAGFSCLPGNLGCPDGPPGRSASPLFPEPRRRRRVPGDPVLRARAPAGTSHPRAGLGRRTPRSASPRVPGEESRSRHWPCPSAPAVQPAGPWPRVDGLPSHFRLHSGLFPGKARAPPSHPAAGTWPLLGQGPPPQVSWLVPRPSWARSPPHALLPMLPANPGLTLTRTSRR